MPSHPRKARKLETNETSSQQIRDRPTQAQGIRQAQEETDPADPTRKVHPDSVPLRGAPQPSRRDQVMPDAEPVEPPLDKQSAGSNAGPNKIGRRRKK